MSRRQQHCFSCGEPLGYFDSYDELVSCGKKECERALKEAYQAEREDRQYRAEQDDFERYSSW